MSRTPEQYAALARLAGLKQWVSEAGVPYDFYVGENGCEWCRIADWSPDTKPEQWVIVLEALIRRVEDCMTIDLTVVDNRVVAAIYNNNNQGPQFDVGGGKTKLSIGDAVCKAALAIIEQEGGKK